MNTGATGPPGSGVGDYTASTTPPVSPIAGDLWYDLSTGVLSIFIDDGNSTQWVQIAPPLGGGSGGAVTVLFPGGFF